MSHQDMNEVNDELTSAVQSVVESFEPYRAVHRPDRTETERWLIWNNKTYERLGVIQLVEKEHSLTMLEKKVLLRTRAMNMLRDVA
jgi:hypothetical protein